MASLPDVGDAAPDFTLPSTEGPVALSEVLRESAALLVFFPKDDTLVCTRQLCNYRDHLSMFKELDVEVIGINQDDLATHEAFAQRYKLPFPLCSDVDRTVCHAYGALLDLWKLRRVLVLVGEDGRVWWRDARVRALYKKATDLERVIRELREDR